MGLAIKIPIKDEFGDTLVTPTAIPVPEPVGRTRALRKRKNPVYFTSRFEGKSHDPPSVGHIHITVQDGGELACDKYYSEPRPRRCCCYLRCRRC